MEIKIEIYGGTATGKTQILKTIREMLILAGFDPRGEIEVRYPPDGSEHWENLTMTRPDEYLKKIMDVV